jgi:hypothetical protein
VTEEHQVNGLQLPSWIVPLAGFAAAVWAIAMWWMVATMPSSGASDAELDLIVARAEIDRLEIDVDELAQQVAALHQERSELSLRLDTLEQAPVASVAVQTTQPISPVAGAPPASEPGEASTTDDGDDDEPPSAGATPAVSATPTPAPTAEPTAIIEPSPTPAPVQYFTDGRDRYNCKDFDSWEEAQAAYEANLPGDPNKIDIDRNGTACEALR